MKLQEFKNSPEYKRWLLDEHTNEDEKYLIKFYRLVKDKPSCYDCSTECETFDEYGDTFIESFMTTVGTCIHCG